MTLYSLMTNCECIMNTTGLLSSLPQGKITLFPCRTEPNLWFCDHETKECITSFYYDMTSQQWQFLSATKLN